MEPTGCDVRQGGYIYRQGVERWSVCGGHIGGLSVFVCVLVVRVGAAGLTVGRVVCSAMLALSLNSSSSVWFGPMLYDTSLKTFRSYLCAASDKLAMTLRTIHLLCRVEQHSWCVCVCLFVCVCACLCVCFYVSLCLLVMADGYSVLRGEGDVKQLTARLSWGGLEQRGNTLSKVIPPTAPPPKQMCVPK